MKISIKIIKIKVKVKIKKIQVLKRLYLEPNRNLKNLFIIQI